MKKRKQTIAMLCAAMLCAAMLCLSFPMNVKAATDIETMQSQIKEKEGELEVINRGIESIQSEIDNKENTIITLNKQLEQYNISIVMTQLDMSQQVQEDFMNSISEKENMTIQQYVQAQSHINIITNLKFLRDWNNEYAAKIGELIKTVEKMESSQESISSDITILKENLTAQKEEAANLQSEIEKETTELNKLIEESKPKYQGVELQYSATYNVTSNKLTVSKGVVNYNGHKETYYSQKVLPGNGLNIPGRHVADDGTIRDGDGYICVAADSSFYSKGSKLMTSLGPAKVYDTGCAYGTIDIYVNW